MQPSEIQLKSFIEQAPGPRGSPQDPHPPDDLSSGIDACELDPPLADTAKTDSCGSSFLLSHFGQTAFCFP
jgi:hypothetical protein